MAHGAPDDSNVVSVGPQERVQDMAELAVRLGGIASIDRWGRVAYQDSFENGVGDWQGFGAGSQWAYLSCERARSGGYCAHLGWDADAEYFLKSLNIVLDFPLAGHVGMEAYFHPYMSGGTYSIWAMLYSPTVYVNVGIKWNGVTDTIQVRDETGTYVDVLDVEYTYGFWRCWRCLKMVVDLDDLVYRRAYWGGIEIDPSAVSIGNSPSYLEPFCRIWVGATGLEDYAGECKVDDFIFTIYEP